MFSLWLLAAGMLLLVAGLVWSAVRMTRDTDALCAAARAEREKWEAYL